MLSDNPQLQVNVACCQIAPRVGELNYNRAVCAQAICDAAQAGAQVVVLPELAQSGYVFADMAEALSLSEPQDGTTLTQWCKLARELGLVLVAGFCERLSDTHVANSAALIDPSGLRAVYRKAHLWDAECAIFTPGDALPPVVQTQFRHQIRDRGSIWAILGGSFTLVRSKLYKPNFSPAPSNVATPNSAKIAAAMECTSFIGILDANLSPIKTAGTSAINIPSVVPITTNSGFA
jgi:hypothetical protein